MVHCGTRGDRGGHCYSTHRRKCCLPVACQQKDVKRPRGWARDAAKVIVTGPLKSLVLMFFWWSRALRWSKFILQVCKKEGWLKVGGGSMKSVWKLKSPSVTKFCKKNVLENLHKLTTCSICLSTARNMQISAFRSINSIIYRVQTVVADIFQMLENCICFGTVEPAPVSTVIICSLLFWHFTRNVFSCGRRLTDISHCAAL